MITRVLRDKFLKNSFIYIIGTLLSGFLGYLFHFLISRKLSVGQYGELQSLVSILAIFGVFASALSYFIIKYSSVFAKAEDYTANRQFIQLLNSKVNRLAIFLFVLFLLFSPLLYNFLHLSDFYGLFIIGIAVIFSIIPVVYRGVLVGWEEFLSVSLVGILSAFLKLFSGFLIVLFFPKAAIVVTAFLIAGLGSWFLYKFFSKRKFYRGELLSGQKKDWQKKYFPKIDIKKTIVPIFIFSLMVILISNIDIILVKNLTSSEMTGYYGVLSLLGKVIFWINSAIIAVVLPNACANGHLGQSISRKTLFSAYGLILFASFSGTLLYFFFPKLVISLLFGAKYTIFMKELWLFGIMALALAVLMLESNLAYARHDFKISYILGAVVVLMTAGIYMFHTNIRQVVLSIIVSFVVGYFFALAMNLLHRKRQVFEPMSNILIPN